MAKYDFDVAVLGAGFGGYAAAVHTVHEGGKAMIVENRDIGGTCLNRGCIATKALLACAETLHTMRHTEDFGVKIKGFTYHVVGKVRSIDIQCVNSISRWNYS